MLHVRSLPIIHDAEGVALGLDTITFPGECKG
jgi:hypothetical protein